MTSPSPQVSAVLARLRQVADGPLSAATAMPPEMYHSEEILHLEQQRMFAHDWVSPGLAAEIPEPGDYLTPVLTHSREKRRRWEVARSI